MKEKPRALACIYIYIYNMLINMKEKERLDSSRSSFEAVVRVLLRFICPALYMYMGTYLYARALESAHRFANSSFHVSTVEFARLLKCVPKCARDKGASILYTRVRKKERKKSIYIYIMCTRKRETLRTWGLSRLNKKTFVNGPRRLGLSFNSERYILFAFCARMQLRSDIYDMSMLDFCRWSNSD